MNLVAKEINRYYTDLCLLWGYNRIYLRAVPGLIWYRVCIAIIMCEILSLSRGVFRYWSKAHTHIYICICICICTCTKTQGYYAFMGLED